MDHSSILRKRGNTGVESRRIEHGRQSSLRSLFQIRVLNVA